LTVKSVTDVMSGYTGPGGLYTSPSGQSDGLFVNLMSPDFPMNGDGLYVSMPFGYPLGRLACTDVACNDRSAVVVELTMGSDFTICRPTSGTIDFVEVQVPDSGGPDQSSGSFVTFFDFLTSSCQISNETVPVQQEIQGCASFNAE
jgi:hypothetical protein